MRRRPRRGAEVPADVLDRAGLPPRAKVLAGCRADDGTWLLGTRDHLAVVPAAEDVSSPMPWERVESAEWDRDSERLRVAEVGEFGRAKPVHTLTVTGDDPARLLQLLRERVTASVLLSRRVVVSGRTGLTVIARRAPGGRGPVTWAYELDPGLDPDDPEVRRLAEAGLRAAAEEIGLT